MAVKASATITLSFMVDVKAYYRFYKLQSSTASAPTAPTTNPSSVPSGWTDSEPTYTSGSTNSLYFVDATLFTDNTFSYSAVSLSSAYEAAKEAYNKAVAAQDTANNAQEDIDNLEIGGRNLVRYTEELPIATSGSGTINQNGVSTWSTGTLTETTEGLKLTFSSNSNASMQFPLAYAGIVESGETVTLSFDYRGNITDFGTFFYIQSSGNNVSTTMKDPSVISETEWNHYEWSFSHAEANVRTNITVLLFYALSSYGTDKWIEIKHKSLKLEKGNKATDWTPAPEDTEADITALETRVTNTETSITQNTEQIELNAVRTDAIVSAGSLITPNDVTAMSNCTRDGGVFTQTTADTATSINFKVQLYNGSTLIRQVLYGVASVGVWEYEFDASSNDLNTTHIACGLNGSSRDTMVRYAVTLPCTGTYCFRALVVCTEQGAVSWQDVSLTLATDELATRISTAETSITQNANAITLRATKTEVTEAIEDIEIGGRNLFYRASYPTQSTDAEIQLADYQSKGSFTQFSSCLTFDPSETIGETYTISFWAKSPNGSTPLSLYNSNSNPRYFRFTAGTLDSALSTEWKYYTYTFTNSDMGESYVSTDTICRRIEIYASAQMGVLVKKIKIEKGNKATDWTPAPEYVQENIDDAQNTAVDAKGSADNAVERITAAEVTIENIVAKISMLVTDENGTTLFEQDSDSWNFSFFDNKQTIDSLSTDLGTLTTELGSTNEVVTELGGAVESWRTASSYIRIGEEVDPNDSTNTIPYLELGEGDGNFKLHITNTSVDFMDGSVKVAYITNQSLYIEKAVIKEELQIGETTGFVWKVRSNGNMGLSWIG